MSSPSLLLLTPACVDGSLPDDARCDFTNVDSLKAVQARLEARAHYSVDVTRHLHDGATRVCQGTLSIDGRSHSEVVCKIGRSQQTAERLRKEANLYQGKLAKLQGRYVPTFVGLFEGETEEGDVACLVLSYEGEPMQQSLFTSGIDFRKKVMDALLAIHKSGVHHGNFDEQSVVLRKDNTPVIVGFGGAEDHDCHLGMDIHFYEPQPHNQAVACEEIYWACVISAVWLPATVEFLNTPIPIEWALGSFDALVAHAPKGTDPDLARMHAELTREDLLEWIEERELYDGQPLPVKIVD